MNQTQQPANVGPYRVVRVLGQGGMGVVYEVVHPQQPTKRLALKLILSENPSQDVLSRFQREAQLLAKVSHPNVVGVLDFAYDSNSRPYMVFDYVAGEDLRSLCNASPMAPEQAAEIGAQLASALDLLHRKGIIHRDLKPENVILRPDGSPVLLDFGLARELDAERLTVTGTILGTPAYMSPEQAEGFTDIDPRTDVYGLGGILYYLLLGQPPFRGNAPMVILRKVLMEEPTWDREQETVVAKPAPLPPIQNPDPTYAPDLGGASAWEGSGGPAGQGGSTINLPNQGQPFGGQNPHQAADAAAKAQATSCLIPAKTKVPTALEAIVRVAMAKERADRHVSAAALRDDLENYLGGGSGSAGSRLRAIAWRRRKKMWLILLGLSILALVVAETWRRSQVPAQVPPSPVAATPTPGNSYAAELAKVPPLGAEGFSAGLESLRKRYGNEGGIPKLAQARAELDALRLLEGEKRRLPAERWRAAWSALDAERAGPVQLELGPHWRWTHEAPGRRALAKYLSASDHDDRREFLGEYGVKVSFLDATGTQALVSNGRGVKLWDLSGAEPRNQGKRSFGRKGPGPLWTYTFSVAHDFNSGLTYLGGTLRPGRKQKKWVGLSILDRTSLADVVGIPRGVVLHNRSDRMISISISPQGRWLAGGTDQGEVVVVPVKRSYGGAMAQDSAYQLGEHKDGTDVQAVLFLDEERLLSLGGDKSNPDLALRLWQVGRGDKTLAEVESAAYSFESTRNSEPPSLLIKLTANEVLVGRSERGRVLRFRVEGTSIQLLDEVKDGAGAALRRSPTAGRASDAAWGRTVYLGSGLFPDEREFPRDPVPGAVSAWVGPDLEPMARYPLEGRGEGVCSLDVSQDGRRLIVGTQLGEVLVFKLEAGK